MLFLSFYSGARRSCALQCVLFFIFLVVCFKTTNVTAGYQPFTARDHFLAPPPFFFKVLASIICKLMRKLYALAIFNDMKKLSHTHLHVTDAGIRHLSLSICPICIMFLQQSPSNVHLQFVLFLLCISSMCLRWQT